MGSITIWILIGLFLFAFLSLLASTSISKTRRCSRNSLDKLFYNGGVIDFIEGIYLVLCISCFINLKQGFNSESISFGMYLNFIFACFSIIIVAGFPIFLAIFYQANYDILENEEFLKKYGVVYESLDLREFGRITFI